MPAASYSEPMSFLSGWAARGRGLFADNKGPWGSPPSGEGGSNDPTPGPWGKNAPKRPRGDGLGGGVSSLEEFLERNRRRFGGSGGGGGGSGFVPDRSIYFWAFL